MALEMSRLTREYVFWDVDTNDNLSTSTVEVAFIDNAVDIPQEADWEDADLIEGGDGVWRVRVLVGPDHVDSIDLTPPTSDFLDYESWTRLTDTPERIVRRTGVVTIL